eukprot:403348833
MGAAIGDTFTCCRKHQNTGAISATNQRFGVGKDLDDAVLAATNRNIDAGNQLVNMLNLTFSCEDLPNLDTFTRTDAMNIWNEIGRTEVVMDNLNPKFIKSFSVEYKFEERQRFKVSVYDVDDFSNNASLANHDFVGSAEFQLHEVVTSRNQKLKVPLNNEEAKRKHNGNLIIIGEEKQGLNNEMVEMEILGRLQNESGFNFFVICKTLPNNEQIPIYKSEIQQYNRQLAGYQWIQIKLLTSLLCNEEEDRNINIEFYKSMKNNAHKNIGTAQFTMQQLRQNLKSLKINKNGKTIGEMIISKLTIAKRHTFLEYVFGGCQINLSVAVDFTLSNGEVKDPESLHYFDPAKNQYLQAIESVGKILQYYDSDKQIPFLGFGGAFPHNPDRASHCFAVNGDIFNPEVDGIEGVVKTYKHACQKINLYGPTFFSGVLKMIVDMAENERVSQDNQQYFILLLITDGIINDMKHTIDQIVRGSSLPISIIIVGVGNQDFKSMDILDADDEPLYSDTYKKFMERDIVQFVPFREFKNNPLMLAKQTLEEVPIQLLSYFEKMKIIPKQQDQNQSREIRKMLSRQQTVKRENDPVPPYFEKLKSEFIDKGVQMGLNQQQVQRFIETTGVPELNYEILLEMANYRNVLKQQNQNQLPSINQRGLNLNQGVSQNNIGFGVGDYNYNYSDPDERTSAIQLPESSIQSLKRKTSPLKLKRDDSKNQSVKIDECKVCMNTKSNTVLVPCGHKCVCLGCSKQIKNICPICRRQVAQIVQVFDA